MSPARRRQAVLMLQDRKGLSERRACQITRQHRSTQRRPLCVAADDAALRARLRKFSKDRPRWGYRRAHARLVEEGWAVNRKRVQRLWREEGMRGARGDGDDGRDADGTDAAGGRAMLANQHQPG